MTISIIGAGKSALSTTQIRAGETTPSARSRPASRGRLFWENNHVSH